MAQSGEDVALHLDQRDRSDGLGPVGVEDRIVAVLPALVGEAGCRPARVGDEAVAVRSACPRSSPWPRAERATARPTNARSPVRSA